MIQPDLLDWQPAAHARRTDPDTSHQAAARVSSVSKHMGIIMDVLLGSPATARYGLTAEEISDLCKLDYHQVARRLPDLVKARLVIDTGLRQSNRSGRKAAVWRAR